MSHAFKVGDKVKVNTFKLSLHSWWGIAGTVHKVSLGIAYFYSPLGVSYGFNEYDLLMDGPKYKRNLPEWW